MKFDKKIVVSAALLCFAPIIYGFGRMVGGQRRIDTPNLETITSNLNEKIKTNLNGYNLACATTQLVAGSLNRYFFENGDGKKCCLEVWMQPWVSQQNPVSVKWKCNTKKVTSYFANCLSQSVEQTRKRRDLSAISSNDSIVEEKTIYDPDVKSLFERFIAHYKRPYSELGSAPIYKRKYKVFEKNIKLVQELNKMEKGTAVYGITKFMDYSYEEFHTHMAPGFTKQLVSLRAADVSNIDSSSIPEAVDWRKQGAVTAVKNQGECGSCWAFSTTGNVEGQWFLRKGALLSLSEQELVDCDSLDQGCDGGLPANAYKSIEKLGGLEREKDYPYEGEDEACSIQQSAMRVYINDSLQLPTDEDKLAGWLAKNGPISIGINANLMQFYWGGISHPWKMFCNPKSLDHGVLIVGYGTEDGTPFWIIKNSWGPDWGEQGYYRIYRGDGSCGVNQMATSAVIN